MDRAMAERMGHELKGKTIQGWLIEDVINYGKSALVLKGTRGDSPIAVKVFDRELVERYGAEAQRTRVLRERELVGSKHTNLINILDAGEDDTLQLFYVVMTYLPWKNLAQILPHVPRDKIHPLIQQVASAAKFLEDRGITHRDIKPENIAISDDFSTAILLDLGVIRPIGLGSITDVDEQKNFVGTLQYGPPEFLRREESDTLDGWRAVTFYQLGAVLHDLIMRQAIFSKYTTPYPRLVDAVNRIVPEIHDEDVSLDLSLLAKNCLIKDPHHRLQLVSWDNFNQQPSSPTDLDAARQRIATRMEKAKLKTPPQDLIDPSEQLIQIIKTLTDYIHALHENGTFPPKTHDSVFDSAGAITRLTFSASTKHALSHHLTMLITITTPEGNEAIIKSMAAAKLTRRKGTPDHTRPPVERLSSIYAGVRDDKALCKNIERFIILAWDQAQEASDDEMPPEVDEKWLTIPKDQHHDR